jgi:hypothetical protein
MGYQQTKKKQKQKIGKIAAELTNETFQLKPSEKIWIP